MSSRLIRVTWLVLGVAVQVGCVHQPPSLADRFMLHRGHDAAGPPAPPEPTLEEQIGKVRRLMTEARPEPKAATVTLESRDAALAAAIASVRELPTADRYVALGEAYRVRGLLDQAYDNYMHALKVSSHQPDAYEGLARVWRDWGLPSLALGDAHRAVYYAPQSAAAANTLGTVLQAIGHRAEARQAYQTATRLDHDGAYAWTNLCYLSFVEGNSNQAVTECRAALQREPELVAAHNNLALAYGATGRLDLARAEFSHAGPSAASYNMGVLYFADGDYAAAAREFDAAVASGSDAFDAARRARQARQLAAME